MLRLRKCKNCGEEEIATLVCNGLCFRCYETQLNKRIKKEKILVYTLIAILATIIFSLFAFPANAEWTQTTKKYDHVLQREYLQTETISNERPWVTEYTQIRQDPLYEDKYYIEEGPFTSPLSDDWLGD